MKPAPSFHVVLRPEPRGVDALGRTPATRLRAFLKAALRRYGLRCVRVADQPETPTR